MHPDACRDGNRWRRRSATLRHTGRRDCWASSAGSGSRRRPPARSDRWWNGQFAGAWRFRIESRVERRAAGSNQVLPGDDFAKPAVIRDEFLDEFMHAALENVIHVAVFEAGWGAPGGAVGRGPPAHRNPAPV